MKSLFSVFSAFKPKINNLISNKKASLAITSVLSTSLMVYLYSKAKTSQNTLLMHEHTIEVLDNEHYTSDISKFMEYYYISPLSSNKIIFLSSKNSYHLTEEIAKDLKLPLGKLKISRKNKSTESKIEIMENVSNRDIVLISSIAPPVNDNLMELLFTISSLKRSSAKSIIVVIPYFGYSNRSEKDSFSNFPLYASLITKLLEALGTTQIITVNLSSKHITGYSNNIPIIDLDMTGLGVSYYIEKLKIGKIFNNPVIISPHISSVSRAKKFQEMLNANGFEAGFGFIAQSNKSSEEKLDFHVFQKDNYVGDDYINKDIIIVDDMIKTGETLCSLADILKKEGSGQIYSFIYHDLSIPATLNNLENSKIKEVVTLNTMGDNASIDKMIKLNTSKVLSEYIGELVGAKI